ncbi:RNA-guided endonuclease InsQ/TnpB family protein [Calderihabitans maritimus]|uniref:Transposase, IS605 OrfB family n=1 Tax=Calderihabitans maritimus TaxID=1246530 RepID=A0A1Z5HS39_9FIRM|nr:RNA-guided endonuclease TnpB family protein [Calderihabitans maritimus]GAW92339.1 transposase, IS605 OrfB family [Calderihabitans maritimus]
MKLVKTVKCKLQVNIEQAAVLLETLQRFADACNDILCVSQENHTTNKVKLQHLCYRNIKEKYGLQANLVIRAIARVAEATKKKRKQSKPRKFKPTSMSLDQRTFSFNEKRWEVSISTVAGRLKLPLAIGNFQRGLLAGQKPTSATLCYNRRTKEFYINIVVNREVPFPPKGGNVIGVDRGIYNLATTSNGLKFSGRQAIHVRRHYARLRQVLQTKGTDGAQKLLKRLSGKEHRWMTDLNHKISKAIVNSCKPGDVIVMEDLRYIRERIRAIKGQRLFQHSWAFGQLGRFIEYKAAERGIAVVYVDPRHTSQRCPKCSNTARDNRHGHLFRCTSCGFVGHADIVAATNIRQVYFEALADGSPSVGPEAGSTCKPLALAMG